MSRLVPSPQVLTKQLLRLLPLPARPDEHRKGPGAEDRILDAALLAFAERGVRSTTMSQIAKDAGISREWLYRHFANRDAVLLALVRRDAVRFIDGLVSRSLRIDDFEESVVDAFVYSVEFLRGHPVLTRSLASEPEVLSARLLDGVTPALATATAACAGWLRAIGGLDADQATIAGDALIRLVVTVILAPTGALDLSDSARLRAYAGAVVPGLLVTTRTGSPS